MSVPKEIKDAKGSWKGKSKLHLSHLPPEQRVTECDSTLHVDLDEKGEYATITYVWSYDGSREEGSVLVCGSEKSKALTYAWVDSWHQNTAVMLLTGKAEGSAPFKTHGKWDAGGEVWGWTLSLGMVEGKFLVKMEVVTPAGEAEWAVDAVYARA